MYTEEEGAPEVEIDLDEVTLTFCIDVVVITVIIQTPQVLDIEDDNLRKKFIRDILTDSKSSREVINVSGFHRKNFSDKALIC